MATETGPSHPTNRKLGVVILGASTYPHFPPTRNLDNVSFARSAAAFRVLIADEEASVFGKPAILDLFDIGDDPTSIIRRIKNFVGSEPALTDILFYYCGHGDFLPDRTYYLTLKVTEPENEAFTGLPLRQMRLALETQLAMKRVFLVLDCCFSGQAAKEWMATGIGHVIEEQIFQSFPKRGTALIAASARGGPALAPKGEPLTMFTGALIRTISTGVAGEKRELSFRDIVDVVRARIYDRYGSAGVAPEIHAPRQDEGDITFTPFFVNRAFVAPPETKAEREVFEMAIADLDRALPRTREAAVETLAELLSSTQSAAFREEILNKLRIVQKVDDSQKVKTRCEEVLARWLEHPDGGRGEGARGSGEPRKPKTLSATVVLLLVGAVLVLGSVPIAFFYLSPPKPVPTPVPVPVTPTPVTPKREPAVTALPGPAAAFGCDGQTGKVIFEDKFTDDSGGWYFGEPNNLVLTAPGATLTVVGTNAGAYISALNESFSASQGDFCAEMSFPVDAPQLDAGIGVVFLARDNSNLWVAEAYASGKVGLYKRVKTKWSPRFG